MFKKIVYLSIFLALTSTLFGQVINFDGDEEGKPPKGFIFGLTGQGKPGVWVVRKDPAAPSAPNVLAQTDADPVSYRFPLCVYEGFAARDVDISVKYKPVSGQEDRAAGIVWRYQDHNNYYIVRANGIENNVVLYKVENGRRTDLPLVGKGRTYGAKATIPSGEWGTLRVVAKGSRFEVYSNGVKLFEVEDTTFPMAGKVGLWTKADSVTLFDDLTINQK
ncbi:MAG: DUF1080 domain-containing protein [Candidatus Aminicenantes bacterium]|nr:DUF1080 domain-containing protein [Candidatus Aminicenantes bacterium]